MNRENNLEDQYEVEFDPFAGNEIELVIPAIEPQLEIWVSCLIGGADANRSYNESVSLHFSGQFSRQALEHALEAVVARHEALRAAFSADGKNLVIYKESPIAVTYADISSFGPIHRKEYVSGYLLNDAQAPFDIVNGPLLRSALFRLSEYEHHLSLTLHHIICDGWSLGLLIQDLAKLYSGYVKGDTLVLPPATRFSQFAIAQQAFTLSDAYRETEQYWLNKYRNDVPALNIPTDFSRPAIRTYKARRDDYLLDKEIVASVKKMGAQAGCSLTTTLIAAFEVLLFRLTGQNDIVLGLPTAGQSATGNFELIGHCVNLLPLRSHHKGEATFTSYFTERKALLLDDLEHQQITFGALLKKLNIPRDASRLPLVPVVLSIDLGIDDGARFEGTTHKLAYNPREYETFEIFLNIVQEEEGLLLEWTYNTQLFRPETIARMEEAYRSLLSAVAADPSLRIRDIPLADRLRKVTSGDDYKIAKTLPALFHDAALKYPDNTAVLFGNQHTSYKELSASVNRFANLLIKHGVKPGDIIGLALDRSAEMLVALLAIMRCGAAYVPLDPAYPQARVTYILSDSSARILLTSKKYAGRFPCNAEELLLENVLAELNSYLASEPELNVAGDALAYILYTSGTSGKPKGAEIEHRGLANLLLSMQKAPGITAHDKLLAITTISFDIAGLELYLPLIAGASVVLADSDSSRDGRMLMDIIRREKITMMQATPTGWRMMLESGLNNSIAIKALCGGEALTKSLADRLLTLCSSLWNMYGPTETTIWSTIRHVTKNDAVITIGKPIDNTSIYILDETYKPVVPGAVGEIFIGGAGVARCYTGNPILTTQKFLPDPFSAYAHARMYKTGDMGRVMSDGDVQCMGRADNQIKLHGYRIEPESIEYTLARQKGVKEAVVAADDNRLLAFVVLTRSESMPADDNGMAISDDQAAGWKQQMREMFPEYMVPSEFIAIEQLPLTPNNKVDRNALLKRKPTSGKKDGVAPRTDSERLVAAIWQDVLGLPQVSIQANFFELGGHSLVAVEVMMRIEKETGRRLPLASLFDAPTVEKLAMLVQPEARDVTWNSLVAIKPDGNRIPLYIVHGYGMNVLSFSGIARNMDPGQPVYGLQAVGLKNGGNPMDKMEDIAAHYVSEILAQNPTGPYALSGYSFGGVIAYEMARQLIENGKEIKMLAMFDAYAANAHNFDSPTVKLLKKIKRQFPKMLFILTSLITKPRSTIWYQSFLFTKALKSIYHRVLNTGEDNRGNEDDRLLEKYEAAYQNYRMSPYDGPIDLFKVKSRIYFLDDPKYFGWAPFAKKGVSVYEVSGDHETFLAPPNDKEFAAVLQSVLDKRTAYKMPPEQ